MLKKGEPVIVWDRDIKDMYTAIAAQDEYNELAKNPLVKIISIIAYPHQHTIYQGEMALEHSPIPEGTICRLSFICKGHVGLREDYESSMRRALAEMMDYVRSRMKGNLANRTTMVATAEYDILARHARGEFNRKRDLITH